MFRTFLTLVVLCVSSASVRAQSTSDTSSVAVNIHYHYEDHRDYSVSIGDVTLDNHIEYSSDNDVLAGGYGYAPQPTVVTYPLSYTVVEPVLPAYDELTICVCIAADGRSFSTRVHGHHYRFYLPDGYARVHRDFSGTQTAINMTGRWWISGGLVYFSSRCPDGTTRTWYSPPL